MGLVADLLFVAALILCVVWLYYICKPDEGETKPGELYCPYCGAKMHKKK